MIQILQLSDTHLFANTQDNLLGVNSYLALSNLLKKIQYKTANIDIIFLTGDISQDGSIESYEHIVAVLASINKPVYWLSGNHDDKNIIEKVFSKN